MSPAAEIAKILSVAGIGPLGSGNWCINTGAEPAEPANCITVYDEGGGKWLPDLNNYVENIRIRVKAIDYQSGYQKMIDIFNFIEKDNTILCGQGSVFVGAWSNSAIASLGRDDNDRFLFAQIYQTMRGKNMTNPCNTTAQTGRKLVLYKSDGFAPTENWTAIAGLEEKGIKFNVAEIDITSDDDGGWQKYLCEGGTKSIEISGSGIMKDDMFRAIFFSGEQCHRFKLEYDSGETITGCFLCSYEEKGSLKDAVKFTINLKSSGEIVRTPAT